jgi:hypothetical protein
MAELALSHLKSRFLNERPAHLSLQLSGTAQALPECGRAGDPNYLVTAPNRICSIKFGGPTIDIGVVADRSPTISFPSRVGTKTMSAPAFFSQFSKGMCIRIASALSLLSGVWLDRQYSFRRRIGFDNDRPTEVFLHFFAESA